MLGELGINFWIVLSILIVVSLGMVLAYRLMHRDPDVKRTRYGFYVERDRYDEDNPPPADWPERPDDTLEGPPYDR